MAKFMVKGGIAVGSGVASVLEPGWRKNARRKKKHQVQIAEVEKQEKMAVEQRKQTQRQIQEVIKVEEVTYKKARLEVRMAVTRTSNGAGKREVQQHPLTEPSLRSSHYVPTDQGKGADSIHRSRSQG